jgi:hypothetical protein
MRRDLPNNKSKSRTPKHTQRLYSLLHTHMKSRRAVAAPTEHNPIASVQHVSDGWKKPPPTRGAPPPPVCECRGVGWLRRKKHSTHLSPREDHFQLPPFSTLFVFVCYVRAFQWCVQRPQLFSFCGSIEVSVDKWRQQCTGA